MGSYEHGKREVVAWIKKRFPAGASCLDVGACNGKWYDLLGNYLVMDAVEIFEPYVRDYRLNEKYHEVFVGDISDFPYDWYDLILFGDVIEHMPVEKAQFVLRYADSRCQNMIIAVPFLYKQGPVRGNEWERHIQDDLTPELFDSRYPGYKTIVRPSEGYAYYAKDKER